MKDSRFRISGAASRVQGLRDNEELNGKQINTDMESVLYGDLEGLGWNWLAGKEGEEP